MHIKIVNHSKHPLPAYATADASGMDLRANVEKSITLKPKHRALVGTGLYVAIPKGFEAQIGSRSRLTWQHGLVVLNSPGTPNIQALHHPGLLNNVKGTKSKQLHFFKLMQSRKEYTFPTRSA